MYWSADTVGDSFLKVVRQGSKCIPAELSLAELTILKTLRRGRGITPSDSSLQVCNLHSSVAFPVKIEGLFIQSIE